MIETLKEASRPIPAMNRPADRTLMSCANKMMRCPRIEMAPERRKRGLLPRLSAMEPDSTSPPIDPMK